MVAFIYHSMHEIDVRVFFLHKSKFKISLSSACIKGMRFEVTRTHAYVTYTHDESVQVHAHLHV
jgi:hypothetical protein